MKSHHNKDHAQQFIKSRMDSGLHHLPWQVPPPSGFMTALDLPKLRLAPDLRAAVQALPSQALYFSISQNGISECRDILANLSAEQWTRMWDYDVWNKQELVPARAFTWLKALAAHDPEALAEKFGDMDEEYQLALLEGKLAVFTMEDVEDLPEHIQNQLYPMPCNTIFYLIKSEDEEEIATIEAIVQAFCAHHLSFAYALLNYSAFQPPGEAAEQVRRFREARLTEDGFVDYSEAIEVFTPISVEEVFGRWQPLHSQYQGNGQELANQETSEVPFLGQVMQQLQQELDVDSLYDIHRGLLNLANSLCSASQVEAHDVQGIHRVFAQIESMVGLGLEFISGGQLRIATQVMLKEHPKVLLRVALTLVRRLSDKLGQRLVTLLNSDLQQQLQLPELLESLSQGKWGAAQYILDTKWVEWFGQAQAEVLKGMLNRYPMVLHRTESEDGVARLQFRSVARLADFRLLAAQLEGLLRLLHLVLRQENNPVDPREQLGFEESLNQLCTRQLARAAVAGDDSSTEQASDLSASIDAALAGDPDELKGLLGRAMDGFKASMAADGSEDWVLVPSEYAAQHSLEIALQQLQEVMQALVLALSGNGDQQAVRDGGQHHEQSR